MPLTLLCPGQGAQVVGMGKDFYESSSIARDIFDSPGLVLTEATILDGDRVWRGQNQAGAKERCEHGELGFNSKHTSRPVSTFHPVGVDPPPGAE